MGLYSLSVLKNWRSLCEFERRVVSSPMIVRCFYYAKQSPDHIHLGIRASKKVGCAVVRNLLRRRLFNIAKNSFSNQLLHLRCVYLISILPAATKVSFSVLHETFLQSCQYLHKKIDATVARAQNSPEKSVNFLKSDQKS